MAPGLGAVNGRFQVPGWVLLGGCESMSYTGRAIRQLSHCSVAPTVSPKA